MKLLGIIRLLGFILISLLYCISILFLSLIYWDRQKGGIRIRFLFLTTIKWTLGLQIHKSGEVPCETALFISNHTSYIDPVPVGRYALVWPVAKAEVASWPLIGYIMKLSGVIFVIRESGDSRKDALRAIKENLLSGRSILIYPEGTSTNGMSTLPFRKGSFVTAVETNIPIVPVTIKFTNPDVSFIDDHQFLPHFIQLFSSWRIDAYVDFGTPIRGTDAEVMCKQCQAAINNKLEYFHRTYETN